jgi:ubiquinone/menaquinone biosynthesis C-methylase UbiE
VSLIPRLGPSTRLLDVGSGTGCLIPHLQARGVADITAVDLSAAMLEQLNARFPAPSVCGNDPGEGMATCTVVQSDASVQCCWL